MASDDDKHILKLAYITVLIIVAVLVLFLLHVLGSLRRRSSHKLLHAVVLGAYTLSYALVSYTLGLMQSSEYYFAEFPVWAVCLLMLLGGTDNLMACKLNDVDNWKSFHVKHFLKGVLVVYIVAAYTTYSPQYRLPLCAILFVNVFQSCMRINSMKMASKSNLLAKNVKPIDDHMKAEDQGQLFDPVTLEGYNYVVSGEHGLIKKRSGRHGEKNDGKQPAEGSMNKKLEEMKITTVEKIWKCKGSLLCSKRGMQLKDICLSMALSKMLNRRFAGFKLAEAGLDKTHDFVFNGLLFGDGDKPCERTFRVIEVELGFVYDLYYTRYPYLYNKVRHFALCLPVAMVSFCSWLTYVIFKKHKEPNHRHNIPLNTTLFLMVVVTFLEAFQLYLHLASDWFKVALIRSYVNMPLFQGRGSFSVRNMIISLPLRLKALRPWENKLGQYSLLQNYDGTRRTSNCIHYVTLWLVDKANKGCKRGKLVKLSKEVKKAVIVSLKASNGHLTNGVRSLRDNGVYEQLSWACSASGEKVIHTILVWHIATTICKHKLDSLAKKSKQLPEGLSKEDNTAINTTSSVASKLSQYCAYLVAFEPDLLPGHSFDSVSMLQETIDEACELLKGTKTPKFCLFRKRKTVGEKCEELLSIEDTGNDILVEGAQLARQLTKEIEDMKLQWKVLSDFWAEMILYIAPCDDAQAQAHLEALARGGEFVTHLWALLTHAGVLERDHVEPPRRVERCRAV